MLKLAHKAILIELARQRTAQLEHALRLAKVTFNPDFRQIANLEARVRDSREMVRDLLTEPASVAA